MRKLLKTDSDKLKMRGKRKPVKHQENQVANRKLNMGVLVSPVFVDEERCDGKLSRTVLEPSRGGKPPCLGNSRKWTSDSIRLRRERQPNGFSKLWLSLSKFLITAFSHRFSALYNDSVRKPSVSNRWTGLTKEDFSPLCLLE
jgi:hypothetical protein